MNSIELQASYNKLTEEINSAKAMLIAKKLEEERLEKENSDILDKLLSAAKVTTIEEAEDKLAKLETIISTSLEEAKSILEGLKNASVWC